ncbi:type II toxin-antitoxin system PemK/MazF family toxin [Desulfotomaculum copahuensis]|uniref:type II toxin-antitoxin system PemK/MazF family toxin n=1 Tax=Desulfotomaculum copahuensis TaxID=1838280 RepID=UPI000AFB5E5B|nr:type II toxin-antitoxin system PemK/MazF family toxin [Desulfotomaculum copahuensis]
MINQGDVFWIDLGAPSGSGPGYRHPHVVVQNNLFNHSRINTVVVYALTSNLRRANVPGNVLLDPGEANLPKASVVIVTQIHTVDKQDLLDKAGTISGRRVQEILAGIELVLEPRTTGVKD